MEEELCLFKNWQAECMANLSRINGAVYDLRILLGNVVDIRAEKMLDDIQDMANESSEGLTRMGDLHAKLENKK